jgi:hypothetical protein
MDGSLASKVRERAGNVCEYCRMPQVYYRTVPFPIDHIIARQHGGATRLGNLALSCLHEKTQTDYPRSSALSILRSVPHNRGSGALEAGGLEPASPGTTPPGRILMRHRDTRPVPPRAQRSRPGASR